LNNYSLPLASDTTRGGVKIGYTENGKNYPVELSSEKMYVNVPWTDTKYTIATGDSKGQIKVTPSSGDAYNVSIKGLDTAAYTKSTSYAVNKELTNEDLDDIIIPGFYNAGGANTVKNKPSGVASFGL
jgi:hypothetical protein